MTFSGVGEVLGSSVPRMLLHLHVKHTVEFDLEKRGWCLWWPASHVLKILIISWKCRHFWCQHYPSTGTGFWSQGLLGSCWGPLGLFVSEHLWCAGGEKSAFQPAGGQCWKSAKVSQRSWCGWLACPPLGSQLCLFSFPASSPSLLSHFL